MLYKIKHLIKKFRLFYALISFFKYKVWNPLKSGRYAYYLKYIFLIKHLECQKLKDLGIKEPKPFAFMDWRIGKGKDKAFRRYYLGFFQGQKCFVKIGKNDATVYNEFKTLSRLKANIFSFSPKMLIGKEDFDEQTTMVAVEFIEGLSKFTAPDNVASLQKLCSQALKILSELESNNLVHADIHKGNLMVCNDQLFLLDYGISKFINQDNAINYIARPGTFYRNVEDGRIYDDAYSFTKLIESLSLNFPTENIKELQEIYQRIDKINFKVTL